MSSKNTSTYYNFVGREEVIQDLSRCGNIAIPFDEQRNVENVARNTSFDAASEVKTHKNNFG